jgi:amino-acid N-acetyltransferase
MTYQFSRYTDSHEARPAANAPVGELKIRRACVTDQDAICAMVRSERLNPTKLYYENFHVAEAGGKLVGAAQMRRHDDGSRELGSLVVAPDWRGQGIAGALIDAVLAGLDRPGYMITDAKFARHYLRWGFVVIAAGAAPRSIRFNYAMGRLARIISWFKRLPRKHLVILRRMPTNCAAE